MNRIASLVGACCLLAPLATLAAPPKVPLQGVLTDAAGAPIEGSLEVVFTLYATPDAEDVIWSEARDVAFDRGFFDVYLGEVMPVEPSIFADNPAVWLGIAIDGDAEMDRVEIGTAPYAAFAVFAGDAATVQGQGPEAFAAAAHRHGWDAIDGIPADLADGDDDTTYIAGDGLTLADGTFALAPCAEGEILARTADGWGCAEDAVGDVDAASITGAGLAGTTLVITEGGVDIPVDLAALVDDGDADPLNELLTRAALDGTMLALTDAGGTTTVDLAALVADGDADPLNEALTEAALDGAELVLTEGGRTLRVDLSGLAPEDGDGDSTNELIGDARLEGTTLVISDAGGERRVELGALSDDADADPTNELLGDARLEGTELVISDAGGERRVELAGLIDDGDTDSANELLSDARLEGTELVISDAGGERRIELAGLIDDADPDPANELLTGASLQGTALILEDAGGQRSVELAALRDDADADPTNELLTGASLQGTALILEDAGGQRNVELAALRDDADADPTNELLTRAALQGTVLTLEDAGGQRNVELGGLVNDADADPTNELLTGASLQGSDLVLQDAGGQRQVNLSSLSVDAQTLSLARDGTLAITGGNSVNIVQDRYALAVNLSRSPDDIAFAVALDADDAVTGVNLPFSVTYGGVAYNTVLISTNGWLEFGTLAGGSDLGNRTLPATGHNGPFVAAYWDDLISTVRHGTEGTAPNRVFSVRFDGRTFSQPQPNIDFTVSVHEGSGTIVVRYDQMEPATCGQGATIGFQGAGAQNAKAYPIGSNVAVLDDNSNDGGNADQSWSITPL